MKIYTRKGDDGTTGLLFGGRVAKDGPLPSAYGTVDEAQSFIGVARAHSETGGELDEVLIGIERDLWVLMADLATEADSRHKLTPGQTLVTAEMVAHLEELIDATSERYEQPTEFVVPGETVLAANLDVARAVVRRAERECVAVVTGDSHVLAYLNRLSDLLWTLARWQEGTSRPSRGT